MSEAKLALEKIVQSQGFGSRKEVRRLIEEGQVRVDGAVCEDSGATFALEGLDLEVGTVRWRCRSRVVIAMHKPPGAECSHAPTHHHSVFSLLPGFLVRRGVQCVGRLDADTTGLLLFSDDGAFIHHHTSPRHRVAKLYEARCVEEVSEEQLERLKRGVVLEGDPTPAQALAERVGSSVIRLTLFEGRYHQVKRMVGAVGNRVETLHRLAIGSFALPDALARGHWMLLGDDAVVQTSKANEGLVS